MKQTEGILASKPIVVNGKTKILVITKSGAEIWVNQNQFDSSADTITYNARKAGDKVVARTDSPTGEYKAGEEITLKKDNNEFIGCGKIGKTSTLDVMDYLISKGITPSFNM